jgi:hypothetical protein
MIATITLTDAGVWMLVLLAACLFHRLARIRDEYVGDIEKIRRSVQERYGLDPLEGEREPATYPAVLKAWDAFFLNGPATLARIFRLHRRRTGHLPPSGC